MSYYYLKTNYLCIMIISFSWNSHLLAIILSTICLLIMESFIFYFYLSCYINFNVYLLQDYQFIFLNFNYFFINFIYFQIFNFNFHNLPIFLNIFYILLETYSLRNLYFNNWKIHFLHCF